MAPDLQTPTSFSGFPNDVLLNILSFLQPTDISAFACTCRRFAALCSPSSPSTDLWLALCDRRWGSSTQLRRWSAIPSRRFYKTLNRWENLIGFWRRIESGICVTPPLVFFEWSSTCIIGFRISRSPVAASYAVCKTPFLWLGFSAAGETSCYLNPDNRLSDSGIIPVKISFLGCNKFVVEESRSSRVDKHLDDSEEWLGLETVSPSNIILTSELFHYYANRTNPGAEKSMRKLRKKVKERQGRRGWEPEDFVKISNYFPTPSRPLQGLWKGISEDLSLEFYLVTHDDMGGLDCWRVGDYVEKVCGYLPVFCTSNTTFMEPPFSKDELVLYSMREHVRSAGSVLCNMDAEIVSRIMRIYCSYDLVPPPLAGSSDPKNVQGRIWEYEDGAFGFGFLRNNFIIDLKPIAVDGLILDEVESFNQNSAS